MKSTPPQPECCTCHATEPLAYTLTKASEVVGCSASTLSKQIKNGNLEAHYANTKPLITRKALVAWLDALPMEPPSKP